MNAKSARHTISIAEPTPAAHGRPFENAHIVTSTPSSPFAVEKSYAPVTMIERPVIVQTMTVSMNVPVIDTRPCLTGSCVCAAAAAIGALPRPASFENIPLATPFCIASSSAPRAPPAIALAPNALSTIITTAEGSFSILYISITTHIMIYAIAMNGTTIEVTLAILFSPPITTSAVKNATTIAVITVAIEYSDPNKCTVFCVSGSKTFFTADAIPFT